MFAVTMSICALTAGQLEGMTSLPTVLRDIQSKAATISSECYTIASMAMPNDISSTPNYLQAMKASAILASVCVQNEDLKRTIAHIGDYTSLSVMHGFYAEANWPPNLTEIERQERRRLVSFRIPTIHIADSIY